MPQTGHKIKGPEAIRYEQREEEKGTFFFSDVCITGHHLRDRALSAGCRARTGARIYPSARGGPGTNAKKQNVPFLLTCAGSRRGFELPSPP